MQQSIPRNICIIAVSACIVKLLLLDMLIGNQGQDALFTSDSYGFYQTAQNIIAGHGFSFNTQPPFAPEAHFTPLYPLVLAGSLAFTGSALPVIILQILLSSLLPILVWRISGFLTQSSPPRTLAAALMAFEPTSIIWSLLLLTEIIAVFFLLLAVFYFLKLVENPRWRHAALAGIFLGASVLTRPHAQFLFGLALLFLLLSLLFRWWQTRSLFSEEVAFENDGSASGHGFSAAGGKERARPAMSEISAGFREVFQKQLLNAFVFAITFLLILSPWLIRNYIQFNTLQLTTTGPRNIYSSLGASILTLHSGKPFHEVKDQLHQEFADKYRIGVRDFKDNPAYGTLLAKEGFRIIREHPKETVQAISISLVAFFTQDLYTDYLQRFHLIPRFNIDFSPSLVLLTQGPTALIKLVWERLGAYALVPVIGRIFWITVTIGWMIGLYAAIKNNGPARRAALIMATIILVYALTSTVGGFGDQGRFRYPASAFMFLLASYGIATAQGRFRALSAQKKMHNA